jgi:hypothetical protein
MVETKNGLPPLRKRAPTRVDLSACLLPSWTACARTTVRLTGTSNALDEERHFFFFDNATDPATVGARERHEALARSPRRPRGAKACATRWQQVGAPQAAALLTIHQFSSLESTTTRIERIKSQRDQTRRVHGSFSDSGETHGGR